MGWVAKAVACLDNTQKPSEQWCENFCDKHGWASTQTSVLKGGKCVTSCRKTASLLFHYVLLHSAGEKLKSILDRKEAYWTINCISCEFQQFFPRILSLAIQ